MDHGKEYIAGAKGFILFTIFLTLTGIGLIVYGTWFGNQLLGIRALEVDCKGNVYLIANYTLYKLSPSGEILLQAGGEGNREGLFGQGIPLDIAVDKEGNIYVADILNFRIQKFDEQGRILSQFGKKGTEPGALSDAFELAVDDEGDIYTVESTNNRLQKFSKHGELIWYKGSQQSRDFDFPHDPLVARDGAIYVCDFRKRRVQSFSSAGKFIAEYPTRKFSDNNTLIAQIASSDNRTLNPLLRLLCFPQRIAQDSSNNFYLLNYDGPLYCGAINKYDAEFNLINVFDLSDNKIPFISYPAEIACTNADRILLTMEGSLQIEQIASDGTYLGRFGSTELNENLAQLGLRKERFEQLQFAGKVLAVMGLILTIVIYRRYKKAIAKNPGTESLVRRID